ncbi:MAG: type IV pilus modification protein PilV [Gammaproteobacteria bacterium]
MYLNHRHQCGVSLIESMIALLVISIGLLGIAALQITAMSQNTSALNHSQSVWIVYDMSDRIRSNYAQFINYAGIDTNNAYSQDCITGSCTSAQLVVADAADWQTRVQNLPAGRGLISSPVANQLLIRVMWDDAGTGATGTACGSDPAVDLTCYTVTMVQ